jgi:uncharacterized membrane protein YqaE (UPF0057 family)
MKIRKILITYGIVLILIPFIGMLMENGVDKSSGQEYIKWTLWLLSGFIGSVFLINSFIITLVNWFSKK